MEFRDQYHVHKALQENVVSRKKEFQMGDESRQNQDVRTRPAHHRQFESGGAVTQN